MDPEKLKVVDLRIELSQRGLDTKGVKSVLVERLRKAIEEENANQEDHGKADADGEDMHDTAIQESDEKSTKSAKIPQTPKKSSRLSKAATPITQREDPATKKRKTSRVSYSRKRTSPKKADQNDMSREPSPTVSEPPLQEETTTQEEAVIQEEKSVSSEIDEKLETKESLSSTESEGTNTTEVVKGDETKNTDVKKALSENESDMDVPQVSVEKSPVKASNVIDPTLKGSENDADNTDQNQEIETAVTVKQEISQSTDMKDNENVALDMHENDSLEVIDNECDKMVDTKAEIIKSDENIKSTDDVQTTESISDIKTTNIPQTEQPMNAYDSNMLEEEQDTDMNENDKLKGEEQYAVDKDVLSNIKKEVDSSINDKQDKQDIEMTEIKQEEDTDVDMKVQDTNDVVRDRKRKRSPSPLEDRHDSPPPVLIENEPEIDDSALILSWYDSDLNLAIDEDGFFTATPMYSDEFSHMWAGARASYGFLCGKVYYEAKIVEHCPIDAENEEYLHVLRIGWSAPYTSMQLGEEKFSFGYSSTGKKLTDNQYEDYGLQFGKDDVIGCYFDATSENNVVLSYTVNGKDQGTAFSISKEDLGDKPLFPHILSKNCSFACNFGQETPWREEILQDYVSIGNVESQYKIPGPRRPEKKEECEVIMMCGLPACGKTTWATKYAAEHPQKMYNILGLSNLIDKMKDPELSNKDDYDTQWKILIEKCTYALDKLLEMASSRRRNYILDQTNVYPSVQRRKMKNFCGYQRKAVVIVPSEEEFKLRIVKHKPIEGKEVTDSMLLEMKANFRAPIVGESFDIVNWIELDEEEGSKLIEKYNKEGKEAGYCLQQPTKMPRVDSRSENFRENRNDVRSNRDNRDSRDYRDRRSNYPDRSRNLVWRGGGNMGRRDRPQRGHIRHGGGYGPPIPRRGRGAPIPPVHRGMDRRGGNMDRRIGNDRGRALASRQGGWAPMGNYQGSQQPSWNQQGNWVSGQSQGGWGQQNNWGSQQWGNWRSYGQGSYVQGNYNQQGYGNGNCNSWNQQYYSQYWGQQQQSGQTTATSGQATNKQ